MFGLFGKGKRASSPQKQIARLHGMAIKYVTERKGEIEEVVGKGGSLSIRDGELLVFSSGDIVMRANTSELQVSELLSGDGVILTAPDLAHGGQMRSVIAHYVYYRK